MNEESKKAEQVETESLRTEQLDAVSGGTCNAHINCDGDCHGDGAIRIDNFSWPKHPASSEYGNLPGTSPLIIH